MECYQLSTSYQLQGIKAVIAESFERIHRSNLVGMGIVPLQFLPEQNAESLGLTGREVYSIDIPKDLKPGQHISVSADDRKFEVLLRFDTEVDLTYYRHGGILNYMIRKIIDSQKTARHFGFGKFLLVPTCYRLFANRRYFFHSGAWLGESLPLHNYFVFQYLEMGNVFYCNNDCWKKLIFVEKVGLSTFIIVKIQVSFIVLEHFGLTYCKVKSIKNKKNQI